MTYILGIYELLVKPRNYSNYRNGNFCKGTSVKLLRELEPTSVRCHTKKSTGFSRMSVTLNALHFYALLQHVNGCFFTN